MTHTPAEGEREALSAPRETVERALHEHAALLASLGYGCLAGADVEPLDTEQEELILSWSEKFHAQQPDAPGILFIDFMTRRRFPTHVPGQPGSEQRTPLDIAIRGSVANQLIITYYLDCLSQQ